MSGVRRVVVGINGSVGSMQALRYAVAEARDCGAVLVPVLAWIPPGGELADRRVPSPYLRRVWEEDAIKRLTDSFDAALGGAPADLDIRAHVVRGSAKYVLVDSADQEDDLLVVGTGRRGRFRRWLMPSVSRFCVAHAKCPVVAVPPPELASIAAGLHGWMFRHVHRSPAVAASMVN